MVCQRAACRNTGCFFAAQTKKGYAMTDKNDLMIFESPEFGQVRSVLKDGEPWFVASDVCKALDINATATRRLDDDEKADLRLTQVSSNGSKQRRKWIIINEPGLYSLVLGSRKPEASNFRRWITHEVIPSIRKHGAYVADSVLDQLEEHPELVSDFIRQLQEENARARTLREQLAGVKAENGRLLPKADYYDSFVSPDDLTCLRYTAKELGVPQNKFIGYLLEHRFVFRDRNRGGRVFALAGKRNDPLFKTRDFYRPNGEKSEYTLVTPAGKAYFKDHVDRILAWEPSNIAPGEILTEDAVFPS